MLVCMLQPHHNDTTQSAGSSCSERGLAKNSLINRYFTIKHARILSFFQQEESFFLSWSLSLKAKVEKTSQGVVQKTGIEGSQKITIITHIERGQIQNPAGEGRW